MERQRTIEDDAGYMLYSAQLRALRTVARRLATGGSRETREQGSIVAAIVRQVLTAGVLEYDVYPRYKA